MNKFFNIIFITLVLLGAFLYRDKIQNVWTQSFYFYFPCKTPIKYSIGTFDTKFGISEADFLDALKQAEKIWETPINKDLFKYEKSGSLKINLVYDVRQETTVQLQSMGIVVKNNKASYDELKSKYDALSLQYKQQKSYFESVVSAFESRRRSYENEVSTINKRGGANKETASRLNTERDYLNSEVDRIRVLQNNLNTMVDNLNALSSALNDLAKTLNIVVDKYNTVGGSLGEEFDEGVYKSGPDGREIDIYQFENKTKLVRVLAHELGHALGLDHNEDPKAIMYRLNIGLNEKLTNTDLGELKLLCSIK